jgi:phosphomannomutase
VSELIISVSGLRGIVGDTLTPDVAIRYATAFAAEIPAGPIVITRDGRASGPMLAEALCGGLTALGRDVINAGVAATPTTGVLVRQLKAAGGIQISASHNPPQYNGLKLFSSDGRVIPEKAGAKVLDRYRQKEEPASRSAPGMQSTLSDTVPKHAQLILDTVNVQRIRERKFRVLVDSNHGAGGLLARKLLTELGCTVTILGETPDGAFEHTPEPTAENLAGVLAAVPASKADVGFCQDPDADRLAVIDSSGRYLGEEYTLAICVDHRLRQQKGPIVTNCSTSRMSQDLAERHGVPFFRSAVGEANVVDLMLAKEAVLGGEGNGGAIDPRVVLVRDSFVGMAMILDAMAARDRSVAQLADELPRYEIVKTKIEVPRERISSALLAVSERFPEAQVDRLDGVRLDWPGKWLLVRASNTEPIVRAVSEAATSEEAARLCHEAAAAIAAQ